MGKSPWTKEYDETLADTFIPIDKYLKNEPTEMQLKYHPKYDPCPDYPDLEQQNEGYPAHRTPEQQAKYNAARFDPHDFQECRFLPQKGMCVFIKQCAMPFVITEKKTVKLEPGLKIRGDVQSVKHIKIKPLGEWDLISDAAQAKVPDEVMKGEWIMSTNCSPIELHFDEYYGQICQKKKFKAVYLDALTRQKAFYPDLTVEQLFVKICPVNPKIENPIVVPPEIRDALPGPVASAVAATVA